MKKKFDFRKNFKKVSPEEHRKAREDIRDYIHKCLVEGKTWLIK